MSSANYLRTFIRWLLLFVDPRKLISWIYLPRYIKHWRQYQSQVDERLRIKDSYPCLADWVSSTPFDPHYFYQGAWLSRRIAEAKPELHVDVGSSVLTVGVMSAQVLTVFVDYRPLNAQLPNLLNVGGSIVSLPFATASIDSLSCLHVLEHIGLGRYGDPIDPAGSEKALHELKRVLAPRGRLYLSVPVGRERVCFNAHRVFDPQTIIITLSDFNLLEFGLVDDSGVYKESAFPEAACHLEYGCGLFVFEKP